MFVVEVDNGTIADGLCSGLLCGGNGFIAERRIIDLYMWWSG